jgi:GTP cyclohydrolase II
MNDILTQEQIKEKRTELSKASKKLRNVKRYQIRCDAKVECKVCKMKFDKYYLKTHVLTKSHLKNVVIPEETETC